MELNGKVELKGKAKEKFLDFLKELDGQAPAFKETKTEFKLEEIVEEKSEEEKYAETLYNLYVAVKDKFSYDEKFAKEVVIATIRGGLLD